MPKTNLVNPWATKDERFERNIRAGIAKQGKKYSDLARKAGISAPTVYVRYHNPGTMTVKELRAFIEIAKLTQDEIIDLLFRK